MTTSNRLTFLRDFRQIAAGHAALCGIADPAALLDRLHRAEGDPEDRNGLLRALVLAAQAPDDTAETATVLLLLAHLPGLDAAYGRLLRHVRDDPDGLASEIAARVTEGILRLDLTRVSRIAATLIRNVERDIRRDLARDAEWQRRQGAIDPAAIPAEAVDAGAADRLARSVCDALGRDGPLVVAVVLDGLSRKTAARFYGLSHDAARKRVGRAMARLAQNSGKS